MYSFIKRKQRLNESTAAFILLFEFERKFHFLCYGLGCKVKHIESLFLFALTHTGICVKLEGKEILVVLEYRFTDINSALFNLRLNESYKALYD